MYSIAKYFQSQELRDTCVLGNTRNISFLFYRAIYFGQFSLSQLMRLKPLCFTLVLRAPCIILLLMLYFDMQTLSSPQIFLCLLFSLYKKVTFGSGILVRVNKHFVYYLKVLNVTLSSRHRVRYSVQTSSWILLCKNFN